MKRNHLFIILVFICSSIVIPLQAGDNGLMQSSGTTTVSDIEQFIANQPKQADKSKKLKSNNPKQRSQNGSFFKTDMDGSDYRMVGVSFGSDFSELVGMEYGIQGHYFLDNGFGAVLSASANYGLESNPDLVFRVGPGYVYPLSDWLYVMGTACYTLTMAKHSEKDGMISGACIIPTIGFAIKQIRIGLNGNIFWRNGGNVAAGAFLSLGYSF